MHTNNKYKFSNHDINQFILLLENVFNPIHDGPFRGCSRMGGGPKRFPSKNL